MVLYDLLDYSLEEKGKLVCDLKRTIIYEYYKSILNNF